MDDRRAGEQTSWVTQQRGYPAWNTGIRLPTENTKYACAPPPPSHRPPPPPPLVPTPPLGTLQRRGSGRALGQPPSVLIVSRRHPQHGMLQGRRQACEVSSTTCTVTLPPMRCEQP